ncbi:MAG TPA: acetamidase/formamidase family protein [Candidatus Angelobacter sp.]|jgi:acetamidase/formamidase|nr:acetamidase/formamidase family protein [Candidatus Angelobacter sp.]
MLEHHNHAEEGQSVHHHHNCGNLFGCGEEQGTGIVREDIKDTAFNQRSADRLLHMDELHQESLDTYLSTRGRFRRKLLQASSFMGMLAAVGPWFKKTEQGDEGLSGAMMFSGGQGSSGSGSTGKVHTVESNNETVHLGVFDTTLPPIVKIDSGDTVSFPNTWSHFLNQLQPGVPVDKLAQMRVSNPGRGPHSIIGPIYVNDAQPGDVLEIRYKRLLPFTWGAVFNNPGTLGTGLLAKDFPQGQVKYLDLDLKAMKAEFVPRIHIPLKPFQGTLGVAPPDGYWQPVSPGVTSSVPPGPHAGNVDLSEMSEGSTMFIPVWKPGALIFTGDSHAVQGDGEINLSALETRMQEMRIQVVLHKQKNFSWPIAETATHWIVLGLDKDLNEAMALAARNTIKFLASRAGLTELDAYALCSIAVSFRVTQVVDIVRGVHAMIPKSLFDPDLRRQIAVV